MLIAALLAQGTFLLGAAVLSARCTIRSRSILQGTLLFHVLSIAWIMLFSVAIPALLQSRGADEHTVVASFPEPTGVLPVILTAWIPGLILALTVRRIYVPITTVRGHRSQSSSSGPGATL